MPGAAAGRSSRVGPASATGAPHCSCTTWDGSGTVTRPTPCPTGAGVRSCCFGLQADGEANLMVVTRGSQTQVRGSRTPQILVCGPGALEGLAVPEPAGAHTGRFCRSVYRWTGGIGLWSAGQARTCSGAVRRGRKPRIPHPEAVPHSGMATGGERRNPCPSRRGAGQWFRAPDGTITRKFPPYRQ